MVTNSSPLKILFAGTPEFAAVILNALIESNKKIIGVYSQPDRPAGRGRKLTASPVKQLALEHDLPIYQPVTLRDESEQKRIADLNPDVMVVVAYGLIIPKAILSIPKYGCINIHASLLPRWRGAAPIQRAILAGDKKTGVTIMQMDEHLDTGNMLYQLECPIQPEDTSEMLHQRLAELGKEGLLTVLQQITQGTLQSQPQDNSKATYAAKIVKEEARLDWKLSAEELVRIIHGFNPWPVAYTYSQELMIKIWKATVIKKSCETKPGTIIAISPEGIDVATGKEILRLLEIQLPGGKILPVVDVIHAQRKELQVGNLLA